MRLDDERRIKGFDGLRAFAFIFVFISHKLGHGRYDPLGGTGVLLFFVLSGLLITRILVRARIAGEAGETTVAGGLKRFYLRRTARIFPIYYGTLGLFLVASRFVHFEGFEGGAPVAMLLFGTNIYVSATGHWVGHFGHFWTLAIEEQFYLLFAPLLLLTPSTAAGRICAAFVTVAAIAMAGLELAGAPVLVVDLNSVIGFGYLGLGGLVGLSLDRRTPAWLVSTPAQAAVALALLAAPLTVLQDEAVWRLYAPAVGAFAALLLFQVARNQASGPVAFLETWPLRSLGRISYGCYIFHEFIHFYDVEAAARKFGVPIHAPEGLGAAVELVATVCVATLSWRILERPVMAWAHRATEKKKAEDLGQAVA